MAITVNSAVLSGGMPSAPIRAVQLNVDLDASYPANGYDISDQLQGGTVVVAETRLDYDGATLRWISVGTDNKVKVFANTNGAKGAEVAATTDVSGHTGAEIWAIIQ